jgi:hypothetical protein
MIVQGWGRRSILFIDVLEGEFFSVFVTPKDDKEKTQL